MLPATRAPPPPDRPRRRVARPRGALDSFESVPGGAGIAAEPPRAPVPRVDTPAGRARDPAPGAPSPGLVHGGLEPAERPGRSPGQRPIQSRRDVYLSTLSGPPGSPFALVAQARAAVPVSPVRAGHPVASPCSWVSRPSSACVLELLADAALHRGHEPSPGGVFRAGTRPRVATSSTSAHDDMRRRDDHDGRAARHAARLHSLAATPAVISTLNSVRRRYTHRRFIGLDLGAGTAVSLASASSPAWQRSAPAQRYARSFSIARVRSSIRPCSRRRTGHIRSIPGGTLNVARPRIDPSSSLDPGLDPTARAWGEPFAGIASHRHDRVSSSSDRAPWPAHRATFPRAAGRSPTRPPFHVAGPSPTNSRSSWTTCSVTGSTSFAYLALVQLGLGLRRWPVAAARWRTAALPSSWWPPYSARDAFRDISS